MTSPKKPGVAFWATVAVVAVLVAYPLSFGPVCRVINNHLDGNELPLLPEWEAKMYSPLGSLASNGPAIARVPFLWYLSGGLTLLMNSSCHVWG